MEIVEISKTNNPIPKSNYNTVLRNRTLYNFTKRTFDIFASLFALVIFAVPMLVIAIAIRIDSPGNAVYKQERLTKDGKKFMLYKFRTMCDNAEKNGAKWADENDTRITRVGHWLRIFRLDEILQFFNSLKGDISIIGPRPEREIFHKQFCEEVENWELRLSVKQGITGLAQINGGYNLSPAEKLVYDLEYIENQSIWLDIKILCKTVGIVFNHKGAR